MQQKKDRRQGNLERDFIKIGITRHIMMQQVLYEATAMRLLVSHRPPAPCGNSPHDNVIITAV